MLDDALKYVAMSSLALLEQVPVGLVADFAPVASAASGSVRDRGSATDAALDADVVRLAEEQLEQRALRVALGFLEVADTHEERARDDAAEVEDHCADRTAVQLPGRRRARNRHEHRCRDSTPTPAGASASVRSDGCARTRPTRLRLSVTSSVTPEPSRRSVALVVGVVGRVTSASARASTRAPAATTAAVARRTVDGDDRRVEGRPARRRPRRAAAETVLGHDMHRAAPTGMTASIPGAVARPLATRWRVTTIASRSTGTTTTRPTAARRITHRLGAGSIETRAVHDMRSRAVSVVPSRGRARR